MMRVLAFAFVMVLVELHIGFSKAQEKNPKPRIAEKPEDAVKYLFEAAKANDRDGFVAQLAAHHRSGFESMNAFRAFFAELDKKFGEDAKGFGPPPNDSDLRNFHDKIEIHGVTQKSDVQYDLTIWRRFKPDIVQEETWFAIKEHGGWKVVFPEKGVVSKPMRRMGSDGKEFQISVLRSRQMSPEERDIFQKRSIDSAKATKELTQKVRAGMYGTRLEALGAFRTMQMRLTQEWDAALEKLRKK